MTISQIAWSVCVAGLLFAGLARGAEGPATVLVEAEGFADRGGWVIDQQFMDQMGSPFLLAHGAGVPVKDATTSVALPAAGEYRAWVRTRDWVAPWKAPGAPGKFQVLVNGQALKPVFGTEGAKWHWQDGGVVKLPAGKVTLALHDLTGFEGRCDAIALAPTAAAAPPNDRKALDAVRRKALGLPAKAPDAGEFDLVVVGGGVAGTCAAVAAARQGLQVALIQDRPVLGGNNSSEVRVHLGGGVNLDPYPKLGNIVRALDSGRHGNARPASYYADDKKLAVAKAEKTLHLFVNMHATGVEKAGQAISAVVARHIATGRELRFPGKLFADCTGDASIGFLAGAEFRMGRESRKETGESLAPEKPDRQTMGASVMWYSEKAEQPQPFPACEWALPFDESTCQYVGRGDWNWEAGMRNDQVDDAEYVRDHAFRAVYGNWAFQKNRSVHKSGYTNHRLAWVAYVAGKRESRRLLGDVILKEQDITQQRPFADACVTTTWTIDLHYPEPKNTEQFPGREFRSIAKHLRIKPYPIPYRCLYSRNVDNLLMAGRNISVTHVALGTIRVMRTTGMMGEVAGLAAAVARKHDTTPRGVYKEHLDELKALMAEGFEGPPQPVRGLNPPKWLKNAGPNLALSAKATASSTLGEKTYPVAHVNDGKVNVADNTLRWCSAREKLPAWVELTWDKPRTISAARLVTGQAGGQWPKSPISDFVLQVPDADGKAWRDIPGPKAVGNEECDWSARFAPVTAPRVRLYITDSPGGLARLWELELYNPPAADGSR